MSKIAALRDLVVALLLEHERDGTVPHQRPDRDRQGARSGRRWTSALDPRNPYPPKTGYTLKLYSTSRRPQRIPALFARQPGPHGFAVR